MRFRWTVDTSLGFIVPQLCRFQLSIDEVGLVYNNCLLVDRQDRLRTRPLPIDGPISPPIDKAGLQKRAARHHEPQHDMSPALPFHVLVNTHLLAIKSFMIQDEGHILCVLDVARHKIVQHRLNLFSNIVRNGF